MVPVRILAAALLSAATASVAGAQSLGDIAEVDILPGWRTEDGTQMAALRVQLAPGWKTYWRSPGDSGIPPSFDFSGSENIGSVAFHWPAPEVFLSNGLSSVGYAEQLILPMEFVPRDESLPASVQATVDLGVCSQVCVPLQVVVSADLPRDRTRPDERIRAALADRPLTAAEAGAGAMACSVSPSADGLTLEVGVRVPAMGAGEFAVVELADPDLWVSEARLSREGAQLRAVVDVVASSGGAVALDRDRLSMTVLGAEGAVELHGCG